MAKEEIQYVWSDKKRTLFGLPLSFTRYFLTETKFITRKGFLSLRRTSWSCTRWWTRKCSCPLVSGCLAAAPSCCM